MDLEGRESVLLVTERRGKRDAILKEGKRTSSNNPVKQMLAKWGLDSRFVVKANTKSC